ncbi:TfoX/Sxy family protein [Demequina sp. SYSU T00192]|uniref:TfoX/Sxy family protein n=1 Tax=Demequina litoralis TaxID=3051660 RepID=A0ABT8GA61_9MICO|nr:TfoX/Sxy family protein [Demequina sp. SYSU T00192]MDN4476023.1 TfoX/Sxy family protein [Demequina sp. SYSU T00192]
MSTSRATVDHLLEQLEPLPVRARAMFGEHGLYCDETFVGVICDDVLFLKPTAATDGLPEGAPYPGAKAHRIVVAETVEEPALLQRLVAETAAALPARRR